jgi:two-component system sensor histidine kinase KdpD
MQPDCIRTLYPSTLSEQGDETDSSATKAIGEMCEFMRRSSHVDLRREPGPQIASLIQSIFAVDAVAIFDADLNTVSRTGEWITDPEDEVRNIYFFEKETQDSKTGFIDRVLHVGNLPVGALLMRGALHLQTSDMIACVTAITFDRYHSFANVSRTESARQTEQLRTTVLDSLAHAYKTPLTAIRAASTGLSEMGGLTPAQADLVALINEQSNALNELTSRLLQTARLEAHHLAMRKEPVAVAPIIENVLANFREHLADFVVTVETARDDLMLCCDPELLAALLTQYIDNARKYATAGSVITLQVAERIGERAGREEDEDKPDEVVFSIHNTGPVIPVSDHERIFDRYYRCSASASHAPGTGIGLSVAKRAAQAHGGDVWVTSGAMRGTTFYASFPVPQQGCDA